MFVVLLFINSNIIDNFSIINLNLSIMTNIILLKIKVLYLKKIKNLIKLNKANIF